MKTSERTERKRQAGIVAKRLSRVRETLEALQGEEQALALAESALTEEPRKLTMCVFEVEFAPIQVFADKAKCTECRKDVVGWEADWVSCPKRGPPVGWLYDPGTPSEFLKVDPDFRW